MRQEIVYINGDYLPANQAKVSIYDRGFLMADAVYEVSAVVRGKLIDNTAHHQRLARSLSELNMPMVWTFDELTAIQKTLIQKNNIENGEIYLQITRGSGKRDFLIDLEMTPTLVMFPIFHDPLAAQNTVGIHVMTVPDIRWQRRDIKTTQLLSQSLARSMAVRQGYDDAWMVDTSGNVTEGTANNAYIVKGNTIFTHPATNSILNGITRRTMIRLIEKLGYQLVERAFTPNDAYAADEAFITSAAHWATPVLSIDGKRIGSGQMGLVTNALRQNYIQSLDEISE